MNRVSAPWAHLCFHLQPVPAPPRFWDFLCESRSDAVHSSSSKGCRAREPLLPSHRAFEVQLREAEIRQDDLGLSLPIRGPMILFCSFSTFARKVEGLQLLDTVSRSLPCHSDSIQATSPTTSLSLTYLPHFLHHVTTLHTTAAPWMLSLLWACLGWLIFLIQAPTTACAICRCCKYLH